MIITCPACHVRYRIDDKAIGGSAGRTVRCASCGHTWHQMPEQAAAAEPAPAAAAPTAASAAEGAQEPPPLAEPPSLPEPPSAPLPEPPPPPLSPGGRSWAGVGTFVVVVLLAIAVLAAVFARRDVVAMWPATARLYALVGLQVEPLGAGLEIRKVIPTRTGDGLVVEGEVINIDGGARAVPQLRVALLDPAQKELRYEIIVPPKNRLQPGETIQFRAPFAKTDETATKVAVTWASG